MTSSIILMLVWIASGIVFGYVKSVIVRVLCITVAFSAFSWWLIEDVPSEWVFWYLAIAFVLLVFGIVKYLMIAVYKTNGRKKK